MFTFWNYYVLKLLCLETITFSDATLTLILVARAGKKLPNM
jgi:hypothetical protein